MWSEPRAVLALALAFGATAEAFAAPPPQGTAVVRFDPAHTVIAFRLHGGLHDTHGAFALKQGSLTIDPSSGLADGVVVVDAKSGDSGNSPRDARMRDTVLEAERYPEIRFHPVRLDGAMAPDGSFHALMHGTLTLHGADHEVSIPVEGRTGGEEWTATCHFVVPYVAWGLTDPSVLFLTVAKEVELDVSATGDLRWASAAGGQRH